MCFSVFFFPFSFSYVTLLFVCPVFAVGHVCFLCFGFPICPDVVFLCVFLFFCFYMMVCGACSYCVFICVSPMLLFDVVCVFDILGICGCHRWLTVACSYGVLRCCFPMYCV